MISRDPIDRDPDDFEPPPRRVDHTEWTGDECGDEIKLDARPVSFLSDRLHAIRRQYATLADMEQARRLDEGLDAMIERLEISELF